MNEITLRKEQALGIENVKKVEAWCKKEICETFTYYSSIDTFDTDINKHCYKVRGHIKRFEKKTPVDVTFDKNLDFDKGFWEIAGSNIKFQLKNIGTIILGDKVVVSDPCYARSVWCMTTLENVCSGKWKVVACIDRINSLGRRCYILELYHESLSGPQIPNKKWTEYFELGVDSGTMSVIDDRYYRRLNGSSELFEEDENAEEEFFQKTEPDSTDYAGLFYENKTPVGAVCSSGIGDDGYPLYIYKGKEGQIKAIKISFL
ncbi:MAG: DUF4241 domain-containing protein [Clostridiales bacterium]|jgi:hypothetical protein|nr:DUF4241 domain-containing protein [Clostridiales bacterium]